MNQRYELPRIITRGRYDLYNGKKLKGKRKAYSLFPKKKFNKIFMKDSEVVIFVHGMRNSPKGAVMGGNTLRRKLRKLGYKKHPVISFSYDANIKGAHIYSDYDRVIPVAEKIAYANGHHLFQFVSDLKGFNPDIKIHLVGHSLGCEVVESFLEFGGSYANTVHLFGSPVNVIDLIRLSGHNRNTKVTNHYNLKDDVIREEYELGRCTQPSCLNNRKHATYKNVRCNAVHHGFRAYADKLRKFP